MSFAFVHRFAGRPARWAAGALLVLGGCGGGLYFNVGTGFDGTPPAVTIATAAASVGAGQAVRIVAAASDDTGIDNVAFYRVDPGGAVLLGHDAGVPYEWLAVAPADGRSALTVFARATDFDGNTADSADLSIPITP